MTAPISFVGVSKRVGDLFGTRVVLHDVSFDVPTGRVCALIGHNGAGKSTLMRLATGLSRPTSGTVLLDGGDPTDPARRRRLGFAAETPNFPTTSTAAELVELHASLLGIHVDSDEVLASVGLVARDRTGVGRFSKGMRQRLALALATLGAPEILILDEPMSGLDPVGRAWVRQLIIQQKRRGTTILFSSHVLADVSAVCDHLVVVRGGRVVLSEPVQGANDGGPWVLSFDPGADFGWARSFPDVKVDDGQAQLEAPSAAIWEIARAAGDKGLPVLSIVPGQRDLERRILPLLEQVSAG